MSPSKFVSQLQGLSFENTFNPYSDHCSVYDVGGAAARRRSALLTMLETAANLGVESIWVGRDLGHKGGRRTGLALTDDIHLEDHLARWGVSTGRFTKGKAVGERTATVVWQLLSRISEPIFLWNVFPLHPHSRDAPFSNRCHNASERQAGEELLRELGELLRPKRIIAIGNDAEHSVMRVFCNTEVIKARHPSYGGQRDFVRQIEASYGAAEDLFS